MRLLALVVALCLGGVSSAWAATPGSLDAGFNPDANNIVWAVDALADGSTVFGGVFTQAGGVARSRIAKAGGAGAPADGFNRGRARMAPSSASHTSPTARC